MIPSTLRFLVLRIGMTGDTLFSFPVIKSLRAAHPNAIIDVVVSPRGADVLSVVGHALGVDDQVTYDFYHPKIGAWWVKRRLKGRTYDAAFVLDTSITYYEMITACIQAKQWFRMVSERDPRGGVQVVQNEHPLHISDQYLKLVEAFGIPPIRSYQFPVPEVSKRWGHSFRLRFRPTAKLIGIHWGNHSKNTNILFPKESFDGRAWHMDGFLKMAQILYETFPEAVFVLTGGTYEARMVKRLHKQLIRRKIPVVNMAGKTKKTHFFMGLLASLDVFVVGDTGPMHLSTAMDQKTVMLAFSTNPQETGPFRSRSTTVVGAKLPCMPCLNQPHERVCPPVNCADALSPDGVAIAVTEILKK